METICPSKFAITVIITSSLIARDAPLIPLKVCPGVEALAEAILAGATTKTSNREDQT
jgi:hypothetical protein